MNFLVGFVISENKIETFAELLKMKIQKIIFYELQKKKVLINNGLTLKELMS